VGKIGIRRLAVVEGVVLRWLARLDVAHGRQPWAHFAQQEAAQNFRLARLQMF